MIDFHRVFRDEENVERINVRDLTVGNVKKTHCSLCIIVCGLIHDDLISCYMPVIYILICRSYILLYVGLTYSSMSVLYTPICPCYILLYANCQPFHTLICRPYILLFSDVFSVIWSYTGEGDIVIHELTQLIIFE